MSSKTLHRICLLREGLTEKSHFSLILAGVKEWLKALGGKQTQRREGERERGSPELPQALACLGNCVVFSGHRGSGVGGCRGVWALPLLTRALA